MRKFHITGTHLRNNLNRVSISLGTNRGRLLLFDAVVHGQVVESNLPIKEHVETKLIVKVAHEVSEGATYKLLIISVFI